MLYWNITVGGELLAKNVPETEKIPIMEKWAKDHNTTIAESKKLFELELVRRG